MKFDREIKTKKVNFDGGTFRLFRGNILVVYIYIKVDKFNFWPFVTGRFYHATILLSKHSCGDGNLQWI